MRTRLVVSVSLLSLFSFFVAPGSAFAGCQHYSNSRIVYWSGYGYSCGLTGSGCSECTDEDGKSCVTNGSSCEPYSDTP